jgi:predicted ATPase
MLVTLAIGNYRSLRELVVPLRHLNLVTGPNGSGKSNLYRALRLLAQTAQGRVTPSLAREGGLQSTLWAGPEEISRAVRRGDHPVQGTPRNRPVSLRLGFASDDFGYAIDLGRSATPSRSTRVLARRTQRCRGSASGRRGSGRHDNGCRRTVVGGRMVLRARLLEIAFWFSVNRPPPSVLRLWLY